MNVLAVFSEKSTVQSFSALYEIKYFIKIIWIFNWVKYNFLSLLLETEMTFYLSTIPFLSKFQFSRACSSVSSIRHGKKKYVFILLALTKYKLSPAKHARDTLWTLSLLHYALLASRMILLNRRGLLITIQKRGFGPLSDCSFSQGRWICIHDQEPILRDF